MSPCLRTRRRRSGLALVATASLLGLGACTIGVEEEQEETPGPEITTLPLSSEDLSDMVATESGVDLNLDACGLMDLTVADVSRISGIELDEEFEDGRADVVNQCAYGLPPVEAEAADEDADDEADEDADEDADDEADEDADDEDDASADGATADEEATADNGADDTADGSPEGDEADEADDEASTQTTGSPDGASAASAAAGAPNVVTVGVVRPASDPDIALQRQVQQLAPAYNCGEVTAPGEPVPLLPEEQNPGEGEPADLGEIPHPYISCDREVAGGGTQSELVVLSGGLLWHLSSSAPSTERSGESVELATNGLLRLSTWVPEID